MQHAGEPAPRAAHLPHRGRSTANTGTLANAPHAALLPPPTPQRPPHAPCPRSRLTRRRPRPQRPLWSTCSALRPRKHASSSERAFREGRSGREFEALTAEKSPVRAPSKARMMPVEVAVRWANVIKAGERKQGCQPAHRMSRRAARRRPRAISSHQCLGRWAGACCRRAAFGARWRHRWRPLGVLGRPVVDKLLLQQLRTASRHRRCTLEAQRSQEVWSGTGQRGESGK
jgi:hypothetical protein